MKKQGVVTKLIGCGFILSMLFVACSKDRVTQDSYQPLDAFYNSNKQQEQVFPIDSGGKGCTIVGKMDSTLLYNVCDSSAFINDTTVITRPYQIGLVEIYTAKDMILWQMSSTAGGQLLQISPAIRVRAFLGNTNYILRPGRSYNAVLRDTLANQIALNAYDGIQGNNVTWSIDGQSLVTKTPPLDSLIVYNLGWITGGSPYTPSSTGVITISVAGSNTQNIGIFVVFKNIRSVMQITNLTSGPIPANTPFTFIAFALNQNNQYVVDERAMTISGNTSITLNLQPTTQANLLNLLGAL